MEPLIFISHALRPTVQKQNASSTRINASVRKPVGCSRHGILRRKIGSIPITEDEHLFARFQIDMEQPIVIGKAL